MDQPPKPAAPLGGFKFKLKLGGVVLPQQDAPPPQPAPVASAPPPPPQPELQRPPSFASASSEQPPQAAPAPKKLLFRISSAALQGAAQAPGQAGPILPKIKFKPPALQRPHGVQSPDDRSAGRRAVKRPFSDDFYSDEHLDQMATRTPAGAVVAVGGVPPDPKRRKLGPGPGAPGRGRGRGRGRGAGAGSGPDASPRLTARQQAGHEAASAGPAAAPLPMGPPPPKKPRLAGPGAKPKEGPPKAALAPRQPAVLLGDPEEEANQKAIAAIIEKVMKADKKDLFRRPVVDTNPQLKEDYQARVTQPMDFSTMKVKHHAHSYRGPWKFFINDMMLVFDNCVLYNGPESIFSKEAERLRRYAIQTINTERAKKTNQGPSPAKAGDGGEARAAGPRRGLPGATAEAGPPAEKRTAALLRKKVEATNAAAAAEAAKAAAPRPTPGPKLQGGPKAPAAQRTPAAAAVRTQAAGGFYGAGTTRGAPQPLDEFRDSFRPVAQNSVLPTIHGDLPFRPATPAAVAAISSAATWLWPAMPAGALGPPDGLARSLCRFAAGVKCAALQSLILKRAMGTSDTLPAKMAKADPFPRMAAPAPGQGPARPGTPGMPGAAPGQPGRPAGQQPGQPGRPLQQGATPQQMRPQGAAGPGGVIVGSPIGVAGGQPVAQQQQQQQRMGNVIQGTVVGQGAAGAGYRPQQGLPPQQAGARTVQPSPLQPGVVAAQQQQQAANMAMQQQLQQQRAQQAQAQQRAQATRAQQPAAAGGPAAAQQQQQQQGAAGGRGRGAGRK